MYVIQSRLYLLFYHLLQLWLYLLPLPLEQPAYQSFLLS